MKGQSEKSVIVSLTRTNPDGTTDGAPRDVIMSKAEADALGYGMDLYDRAEGDPDRIREIFMKEHAGTPEDLELAFNELAHTMNTYFNAHAAFYLKAKFLLFYSWAWCVQYVSRLHMAFSAFGRNSPLFYS